ncbi:MAG: YkgJ family cysteine cluster protein [Planctomycetota bacterium]
MVSDKSPWYRDGLRFECTQCGHCCKIEGYVWVDEPKIAEIAGFLKVSPAHVREEFVIRVGTRLSLTEKPNHECVFWQDGCTIYPVRPEQCRTFPFWKAHIESPRGWKAVAKECEGVDRGRRYTRQEIDAIARGSTATDSGKETDN